MNENTPNKPPGDQPEAESATPDEIGSTIGADAGAGAGPAEAAPGATERKAEAPSAPAPPVTETAQRSGGGRGLALFALLLAILAAVGSGYVFWNQRQATIGAESKRSNLDTAIGRLDDATRQLSASLTELERNAGQLQSNQS
ncbi:MAG: hypothetical protein WBN65_04325, partial [Gammaproteobacteria bacterium]